MHSELSISQSHLSEFGFCWAVQSKDQYDNRILILCDFRYSSDRQIEYILLDDGSGRMAKLMKGDISPDAV